MPSKTRPFTESQLMFLRRASLYSFKDNDPEGGIEIANGNEAKMANGMALRGLLHVSMPRGGYPFGKARITDAGREALKAGRMAR